MQEIWLQNVVTELNEFTQNSKLIQFTQFWFAFITESWKHSPQTASLFENDFSCRTTKTPSAILTTLALPNHTCIR